MPTLSNHFRWLACQEQGRVHMKLPQMKAYIGLKYSMSYLLCKCHFPPFSYLEIDLLGRSWPLSNTVWLLVFQV